MSVTPYSNTGHNELSTSSPAGTDPINEGDDHLRKIQAFLKDGTAGLGKILGSLGQNKSVQKGSGALSTPSDNQHCFFYLDTTNNRIYFALDGVSYPLMPSRGATAGKFLKSAGADALATWSNAVPVRGIVESHTALSATTANAQAVLTGITLPTGITVNSGNLRVSSGYTVIIRGMVHGHHSFTCSYRLFDLTNSAVIQQGIGGTASAPTSLEHFGYFDVSYTNSSGSYADIQLQYTISNAIVLSASSTYPNARLIVEIYPN